MATTLYWVVVPTGDAAYANDATDAAKIRLGQTASGAAATAFGSEPAPASTSTVDEQTPPTNLSAGTAYRIAWTVYDDVALTYGGGGVFTVVSAEFRTSYALAADGGSYAVTGQAADTVAARRVAADAGSLVVTGSDADTIAARRVAADAGSLAVTGTAADLIAVRLLDAEAGSIVLTGQSADMAAGVKLAGDAGSITVTGADASLVYQPFTPGAFNLAADAGSYAVTGSDAALIGGRLLALDSGAYTTTGQASDLVASRALAADPGAYTVTGSDADLEKPFSGAYALAADAGSYFVSETDASLVYSGATDTRAHIVEIDAEPTLWWQRKPKKISEPEAKAKLAKVAKVIAKKAKEQVSRDEVLPMQQRIAEVRKAVAPLIAEMPGFGWKRLYDAAYDLALSQAIDQAMQAQERRARELAQAEIARIRALDDEEVALLAMMI